jgi:tRNA pseudouridine55 synthase
MMDGILNILKPPGMTSHDVVAYIRKKYGIKKVGHSGTLDPNVAGVLVLCLGRATRIVEYLMEREKSYRGEMILGLESSSHDLFGNIREIQGNVSISIDKIKSCMQKFTGKIEQIPPMVSAVHYKGRRLYELASEGKVVERSARPVVIHSLEVRDIIPTEKFGGKKLRVIFDVDCSKGTYIRTLCHDIGRELGCGGVMSFLIRTASGGFTIDNSHSLEEFDHCSKNNLREFLLPMDSGVLHFKPLTIDSCEEKNIICGKKIYIGETSSLGLDQLVRVYSESGDFLAVYRAEEKGVLKPVKVFV